MTIWHSILTQMQASLSSQLVGGGLVLMFTGSVIALVRNMPGRIWALMMRFTSSVIEIKNTDPLFDFVTFWIDGQEKFRKSHYLFATTENRAVNGSGNEIASTLSSPGSDTRVAALRVFFSPSGGNHFIMREGRWVKVSRSTDKAAQSRGTNEQGGGGKWQHREESYYFTGFGRSQEVLKRLIDEIVAYGSKPVDGTRVFFSTYGYWQSVGRRKMRSLESVILPEGVISGLVADAKEFLSKEEWYREIGIPWHRGYLFFGVPGSGKTSLAAALAGALHMDLYLVNIAGSGMNDERLASLMSDIRSGSMIVMEDIDCTVPSREDNQVNRVTLSGLLNCLDGIMSREGCMIVMTTNYRDRLDSALIRPGRVDHEMEFGFATLSQKRRLATRLNGVAPEGDCLTMAECQQILLAKPTEKPETCFYCHRLTTDCPGHMDGHNA